MPLPGPDGTLLAIPTRVTNRRGDDKPKRTESSTLRYVNNHQNNLRPNLIYIPSCIPAMKPVSHTNHPSMLFCLVNARSIRNKSSDIFDYICERKIDLCALTETWLRSDDDATRAEICPTGYKFLDQPRTDRPG